jgi:glutamine synthetase adenylyltransferase
VRRSVLQRRAMPRRCATEVQAMRAKVRQAHPVKAGRFDVKHSEGGMLDVEFAVQYLVLAYSRVHAGLLDNVGNIALLQRAEQVGLLPDGVGSARGCLPRSAPRPAQGPPRRAVDAARPGRARRAARRGPRAVACGLRLTPR